MYIPWVQDSEKYSSVGGGRQLECRAPLTKKAPLEQDSYWSRSRILLFFLAHDLFLFLFKENNKKCPTHNMSIQYNSRYYMGPVNSVEFTEFTGLEK